MLLTRAIPYLALFLTAGCTKKSSGGGGGTTTPSITVSISSTTVNRQDTATHARFFVDLSAAATSDVTVSYATQDSTAKSGTDYVAATGTLTIKAGTSEGYFDVVITGDSLRQNPQVFHAVLSNPAGAALGTATAAATIINDGTYLPVDTTGDHTPTSYPGYTLAWSDEFNTGHTLDPNSWNYEQGGSGWGNQELENYTNRIQNAFLSSGVLVIEARQESYGGNNYTSARLDTYGKHSFTHGRIDIRAKLPVSTGMWPALWMLGNNINTGTAWPACGEMDIMELIGTYPSRVTGSIHWEQANNTEGTFNNNYNLSGVNFSQAFHTFSEVWTQDSVTYLVDNQVYVQASYATNVTSGVNPFNSPFFFIFNVAVGGNWPGPPDGTTVFPQRMFVDYVRVYQ
ncbi:family 16 glycosylhydrolase [Dinghuibacter silviterrae]|uniref:Calx-beta domain-containing protein n=1 Tax=Dinghuibacter silviterrae TaxID=1539049 RepID=A0A4R8DSD4_9BACT|nr:family 16 glycosylhydrolase [Dinghuibacter silviterrae]TDX01162.1 Calx-beta domain-containing protein [Dinghuibacter silviterrae]